MTTVTDDTERLRPSAVTAKDIEAAYASADYAELTRLAHSLKGCGGTAGFKCLTEPASRLEKLARSAAIEQVPNAIAELRGLQQRITA